MVTKKIYAYQGRAQSAKAWAAELGISRDAFYQRVEDLTDPNQIFASGYKRKPAGKVQRTTNLILKAIKLGWIW